MRCRQERGPMKGSEGRCLNQSEVTLFINSVHFILKVAFGSCVFVFKEK